MKKVGILGGGQLGQMLMVAGYALGIDSIAYEFSTDCPAGLTGKVTEGSLSEAAKLRRWASQVDVVTYEWENIPAALVSDIAEHQHIHPGPKPLAAAKDRWHEKKLLNAL